MKARVLFNAVLFAVLLVGIGVFVQRTTGGGVEPKNLHIAIVSLLAASWGGALVAMVEHRVYDIEDKARRALAAAGLGALAYLGLFVAVAALAWRGPPSPLFLALGLGLGAVSHATRALIYGGRGADASDEAASDPPGDST
jgi:peptidoglycan/LPS O-acetylase OafA/YrhL